MGNYSDWSKEQGMKSEGGSSSSQKGKGNFKNDPERASREGKKGGEASRRS